MKHSIEPDEHELGKARRALENAVSKYEHSVEAGEIKFYLGWQDTKNSATVITETTDLVTVILNPGTEWEEELETEILRSLLEIEFIGKADYEMISFNWQDVTKWAYVITRMNRLLDEEAKEYESLDDNWTDLREELGDEITEQSEFFHINSVSLGEMLGEALLEDHDLDEFPGLKQSDIAEAGDRIFE